MTKVPASANGEEPFQGALGRTSELVLAQHFIATRNLRYSQIELARATGMARQTVASALENLSDWQVVASEKRGSDRVFYLDERSPLAYALDVLAGAVVEEITGFEVLPRPERPEELKLWKDGWLLEGECAPAQLGWSPTEAASTDGKAAA